MSIAMSRKQVEFTLSLVIFLMAIYISYQSGYRSGYWSGVDKANAAWEKSTETLADQCVDLLKQQGELVRCK